MFLLQNKQLYIVSPHYWHQIIDHVISFKDIKTTWTEWRRNIFCLIFLISSFSFLPYRTFCIFLFYCRSDGPVVPFCLSNKLHCFHNDSCIACFTKYRWMWWMSSFKFQQIFQTYRCMTLDVIPITIIFRIIYFKQWTRSLFWVSKYHADHRF